MLRILHRRIDTVTKHTPDEFHLGKIPAGEVHVAEFNTFDNAAFVGRRGIELFFSQCRVFYTSGIEYKNTPFDRRVVKTGIGKVCYVKVRIRQIEAGKINTAKVMNIIEFNIS